MPDRPAEPRQLTWLLTVPLLRLQKIPATLSRHNQKAPGPVQVHTAGYNF